MYFVLHFVYIGYEFLKLNARIEDELINFPTGLTSLYSFAQLGNSDNNGSNYMILLVQGRNLFLADCDLQQVYTSRYTASETSSEVGTRTRKLQLLIYYKLHSIFLHEVM